MFQKSLLKNFIKSFQSPDASKILKLVTKEKFIAEDANGAEFISLLADFFNWKKYERKKAKYDKETKYAIAEFRGKKIYTTEFLIAKNQGWIEDIVGHKEICKEYLKIIPHLFGSYLFDEVLENIKDSREIFVIRLQGHRFFHILNEENFLISFFVMGDFNFGKQLDKRFRYKNSPKWEGGHFSILSPARSFWRHLELLEQFYQILEKNTMVQEDFISLVDGIIESKKKIAKYKKHFKSLNAVEKIEIKEEIEKLEKSVEQKEQEIDALVYKPKLCNRKLKILPIIALKAHSLKIYTTNKVA